MSIIKANQWQNTSGSVLNAHVQVVVTIDSTQRSTTNTSLTDLLSVTITPKFSNSKFYIETCMTFSDNGRGYNTNNAEMKFALKRSDVSGYLNPGVSTGNSYNDGTFWWGWDAELGYGQSDETNAYSIKQAKHLCETSGSTAGTPITFTVQWKVSSNTGFLNRCYQSTANGSGVSYMKVTEVAQ